MRTKERRPPIREHEILRMDKALGLVGGSFVAAAKLVDMHPDRFRALVQRHRLLKDRWSRPRGSGRRWSVGFQIEPYVEPCLESIQLSIETVLTAAERVKLRDWLRAAIDFDEQREARMAALNPGSRVHQPNSCVPISSLACSKNDFDAAGTLPVPASFSNGSKANPEGCDAKVIFTTEYKPMLSVSEVSST